MIYIEYFAILKEQSGLSNEELPSHFLSPKEVYAHLKAKHGFTLNQEQVKVALNDEFSTWDTPLKPSDKLVFIPPVAGG